MVRVKAKPNQPDFGSKPMTRSGGQVGRALFIHRYLDAIVEPSCAILIVTALSFATRLYQIHEPAHVSWDETHFGKMASWYINRTFFFDVHPPLGKMLIALSGHLTGYDGRFPFDKPGDKYESPSQYLGMRIFCATLGLLIPTMIYRATLSMTKSKHGALIAGLLIVFDNGMTTLSRYILLDPPLLFYITASILGLAEFSFNLGPSCDPQQAFSLRWWFWLFWTGISIACAFSVKFVGLFIVIHIGLRTVSDIWAILGDTTKPILHFIKHFAARALCLIVVPICMYVIFFWLHLNQLNRSGNGDGFYSSAFQSQLVGNSLHNSQFPAHLAYGAEITIKNNRIGGAYLHSHWHLYPEGVGAKQQQVTTYSHKDSNNKWLIKRGLADQRPNDTFVRDGDLIILEHIITRRNLHSHYETAPLTKRHYQVTCYGENGFGDANDVWKIEKEHSSSFDEDDRIYTVRSRFRLIHYLTNCALHSHSKQLPKWGYEQMEVTCNPKLFDRNNLWNIEDNSNPNLPNVSFEAYAPSFVEKFVESHAVMLQGNAGLKPKEGEVTSKPWQWPLNYRGQFFSASEGNKIYLLGNPIIWWTNIVALMVSLIALARLAIMRKIAQSKRHKSKSISSDIDRNFLEASSWTLLGWALHYIPFYFMGRVLYFHHYFPAFIFSCMLTATTIAYLIDIASLKFGGSIKIEVIIAITAITAYTFLKFWPLTYGGTAGELSSLKWLDSWEI